MNKRLFFYFDGLILHIQIMILEYTLTTHLSYERRMTNFE